MNPDEVAAAEAGDVSLLKLRPQLVLPDFTDAPAGRLLLRAQEARRFPSCGSRSQLAVRPSSGSSKRGLRGAGRALHYCHGAGRRAGRERGLVGCISPAEHRVLAHRFRRCRQRCFGALGRGFCRVHAFLGGGSDALSSRNGCRDLRVDVDSPGRRGREAQGT